MKKEFKVFNFRIGIKSSNELYYNTTVQGGVRRYHLFAVGFYKHPNISMIVFAVTLPFVSIQMWRV